MLVPGQTTFAQTAGTKVSGTIVDSSQAFVSDAVVTLTDSHGNSAATVSNNAGVFTFDRVQPGAYKIAVEKDGFAAARRDNLNVTLGATLAVNIQMQLASSMQSVTISAHMMNGVTTQPSQEQLFESGQSTRTLDRSQMDTLGPVAGAGQILSLTPGANVTGYGNTGAQKYSIMINGISQGWGGYGGLSTSGSLAVTFDGIPMSDPATDLWQSDMLPVSQMIQNTNVTYGSGEPADRWYNNIGGGIDFTPVQPTDRPHATVSVAYGSYQQKQLSFNASSGLYHGWSTLLAGGGGQGNDFRTGIGDGFASPSKDFALYSKTLKSVGSNSFELGGYYAHSGSYRSQVTPIVANPLITVSGTPGIGEVYSEQTSGYYSTLPYNSYNKYDTNDMAIIYGRETMHLDPLTTLQNTSWFQRIDRTHYRTDDVYSPGAQLREWNDPHTDTIGDRLSFSSLLPKNTISGSAYYIHALYNTRNNFYNPADGGSKTVANIGGKVRSSYFNQDDFAIALQDDIHPIDRIHITPGIRYVGFTASFADHAQQDFTLGPGAIWDTACRYNGEGESYTNGVNDQGACPANSQNRSGVEPSIDANAQVLKWLAIYGGYAEALRAPELGGGGGVFQSVDPSSYHLQRGKYGQVGFKIHTDGSGFKHNLLFGLAYFHNSYENQEIDTSLANGDTIDSSGSSLFRGVNMYFDDDPIEHLTIFTNATFQSSKFTNYVTGGVSYNDLPVSYVPNATFNFGATYDWAARYRLHIQPTFFLQTIGSQHIFDNSTGTPSQTTMPSYTTANFSVKVPLKRFDVTFNASNLTNSKYNEYEYISAGSYFGTSAYTSAPANEQSGYLLGYPGAPFTAYGSVTYHF